MVKSGKVLSNFILASKRPRNQIATVSGLTNTYIRNLEHDEIENVPKKRIIALAVALNLDLTQLEELLFAFDRSALTVDDIPVFIDTAKRAKLSEAVLPVRDFSAYELILLSLERASGHEVIVNDRPTACLMVEGHRTHKDRAIISRHPIYKELNEAIGNARRDNFLKFLKSECVDHYICKKCLENYLHENIDHSERLFRYRHVRELLHIVTSHKNFHLYLTDSCFNQFFTIKLANQEGVHDKLSYSSRSAHEIRRGKRGRLIGFITENPALCECFKEEVSQISRTVIESLTDKCLQRDYLYELIAPIGAELGEKLPNGKD